MSDDQNYMGLSGYIWWIGVVENRNDPLHLGRCQVRIRGWHTSNKEAIPSDHLHWALPLVPVTHTHRTPLPPKPGTIVGGYFLDADHGQYPVMTGIFPGIPETTPTFQIGLSDQRTPAQLANEPRGPASKVYNTDGSGVDITEASTAVRFPFLLNEPQTPRFARNEQIGQTFVQERKNSNVSGVPTADNATWDEPQPGYAAVYPFNDVMESESGHIQEIDDTPGHERISESHRSGTFYEIQPDGTKITKVVKNNYEIIMSDDNVLIMGTCNITVNGNANVYVKKDMNVKVDGNMDAKVQGNMTAEVQGDIDYSAQGTIDVTASGPVNIKGATVNLN